MPTTPQITVAMAKARTMRLSYLDGFYVVIHESVLEIGSVRTSFSGEDADSGAARRPNGDAFAMRGSGSSAGAMACSSGNNRIDGVQVSSYWPERTAQMNAAKKPERNRDAQWD